MRTQTWPGDGPPERLDHRSARNERVQNRRRQPDCVRGNQIRPCCHANHDRKHDGAERALGARIMQAILQVRVGAFFWPCTDPATAAPSESLRRWRPFRSCASSQSTASGGLSPRQFQPYRYGSLGNRQHEFEVLTKRNKVLSVVLLPTQKSQATTPSARRGPHIGRPEGAGARGLHHTGGSRLCPQGHRAPRVSVRRGKTPPQAKKSPLALVKMFRLLPKKKKKMIRRLKRHCLSKDKKDPSILS